MDGLSKRSRGRTVTAFGARPRVHVGEATLANGMPAIRHPGAGVLRYTTHLWGWGINGFGELGNHASVDSDRPLLNSGFPAGTLVTEVAAGDAFGNVGSQSFALDRNHGVWGWGYNQFGQVGDGNASANANVYGPVHVCAAGQTAPCRQFFVATAIAAGGFHSLGIDNSGRVWGWGYNAFGQLGTTGLYSAVPVWNAALSAQLSTVGGGPIKAIAAGGNHSLALDSFGNVWAWGSNGYGQLGNGLAGSYPVDYAPNIAYRIGSFPAGNTITALAAGGSHSLALDSDGNVWAWGRNENGQLGLGSFTTTVNTPRKLTALPSGTRIVAIAAGAFHSIVLDSAGNVRAFGDNAFGQLGNETNIDSHGPVQTTFPTGIRIISIAAGGGHNLAIDRDNSVWAWGLNNHGQLGNQQTGINSNKPLRSIFPAGTRIVDIAAGSLHSLAIETRLFLNDIGAVLDTEPLPTVP